MKLFRSDHIDAIVTALAFLFAPTLSSAAEQEQMEPPWEDLAGLETAEGSLGVYIDQCSTPFGDIPDLATSTVADQYEYFSEREANMTAGVCLQDNYMCGFTDCQPFSSATTALDRWTDLSWFPESPTELNPKLETAAFDSDSPESDIPAKIVFPRNVGDIVSVVEFAKKNKL